MSDINSDNPTYSNLNDANSDNSGLSLEPSSSKNCWVCFATESDDRLAAWVQPCNCSGTTKWVHQACLQRWVDEKQRGNLSRKVLCPQCKAEYLVVFPSMGSLVTLLDKLEEVTARACPFVTGGVLLGSVYWTAITYGAMTVMQVVGNKEGLDMMESADPLVLLILLPSIPVALISAKLYNWEDSVLMFLRRSCSKVPVLRHLTPFGIEPAETAMIAGQTIPPPHVSPTHTHISPTRVFCTALLLPTISTLVGKIFFSSIKNNLHRTIIGGISYIAVKGALKIYYKQMLYIRQSNRKILDYTESNIRLYRGGSLHQRTQSTQPPQSVNTESAI